ncbi:hypothetical protein [Cloacibacillus evryensis]|uniref:hypothetical protein n=1 Tax=Cloacibacillus evryensis TaxID=508460 RepID=UPI00241CD332|nr:hypothetical protein [Cloacibacillus evryensis]
MTQTEFESLGFMTRVVLEAMAANDGDAKAASKATGSSVRSVQSIMCRMRKRFGMSPGDLLDAVKNRTELAR